MNLPKGKGARLLAGAASAIAVVALSYAGILLPWRAAMIARSAEAKMRVGLHAEALADCDRALQLRSTVARARAVRAHVLSVDSEDMSSAVEEADRALAADPASSLAFAARARAKVGLEMYNEALEDGERAVALDPSNELAWLARGLVHLRLDHEQSLADCDQALGLNRHQILGLLLRAVSREAFNQVEPAMGDANAAIELRPLGSEGYVSRAHRYSTRWRVKEAMADADRAVRLDPRPGTYVLRGSLHLNRNGYEEARKDVQAALSLSPRSVDALLFRASVTEAEAENLESAIADCTAALEINPRSVAAHFRRASVRAHLGRWEEALQDAERAMSFGQRTASTFLSRGGIRNELGKDVEAAADFDEACRLDPRSVSMRASRCYFLVDQGKDQQALEDARVILEQLDSGSVDGRIARAYARIRSRDLGTVRAAIQDCTEAQALAPDHETPLRIRSSAWQTLAYLHAERGETSAEEEAWKNAIQDIEAAKSKDARSALVRNFEGGLYLSLGEGKENKKELAIARQYYERAKAAFEEALRRNPNYLEALQNLARARFHLGDYEGAMQACNEARKKYPDRPDSYETVGRIEFTKAGRIYNPDQPLSGMGTIRDQVKRAKSAYQDARKRAVESAAARIDREVRNLETWESLYESTVLLMQRDFLGSRRRLGQAERTLPEFPYLNKWKDDLERLLRQVGH